MTRNGVKINDRYKMFCLVHWDEYTS